MLSPLPCDDLEPDTGTEGQDGNLSASFGVGSFQHLEFKGQVQVNGLAQLDHRTDHRGKIEFDVGIEVAGFEAGDAGVGPKVHGKVIFCVIGCGKIDPGLEGIVNDLSICPGLQSNVQTEEQRGDVHVFGIGDADTVQGGETGLKGLGAQVGLYAALIVFLVKFQLCRAVVLLGDQ